MSNAERQRRYRERASESLKLTRLQVMIDGHAKDCLESIIEQTKDTKKNIINRAIKHLADSLECNTLKPETESLPKKVKRYSVMPSWGLDISAKLKLFRYSVMLFLPNVGYLNCYSVTLHVSTDICLADVSL